MQNKYMNFVVWFFEKKNSKYNLKKVKYNQILHS